MKKNLMLSTCLRPKILISIALVMILAFIFLPSQIAGLSPVLLILTLLCPLSMLVMMGMMQKDNRHDVPFSQMHAPLGNGRNVSEK